MIIKSIALMSYAIIISVVFTHSAVASELKPIELNKTGIIHVIKDKKDKVIAINLINT